ncbi:hypothetical protein MMC25_004402 [Agyrium rufum]|nr:hypothetical protein [Agyrium rufum]
MYGELESFHIANVNGFQPFEGSVDNLLKQICQDRGHVFIVIDALDEGSEKDGNRGDLIASLNDLLAEVPTVQLLISSRPQPSLLNDFVNVRTIQLTANAPDIQAYLYSTILSGRATKQIRDTIDPTTDEKDFNEKRLVDEDVISLCAGLITTDDTSTEVRLVHHTTQEFFTNKKAELFPM